jgi:hypothetical protein
MFMMIVMIVLCVIASGVLLNRGIKELDSRKTYALPTKEVNNYSWAARQVLKNYNALPPANRPAGNITHMLTALDIKYGKDNVDGHFGDYQYVYHGGSRNRTFVKQWKCNCRSYGGGRCKHYEYKEVLDAIQEIQQALAEQAHALELAGVESGLTQAASLAQQLREEKQIIEKVTRETVSRELV